MIRHFDADVSTRRVSPTSGATARGTTRRPGAGVASALALLLCLTASLGAQAPPAGARDTTKVVPVRRASWTSDRRTFAVGDIIKIIINENVSAEANKNNSSSASRRRAMGVGISPPSMGAAAMPDISGSVESSDGGESHNKGSAANGTSYDGDLAVRVIAITPDGLLQIKGAKTIDVDKNKQTITITGFIRPMDVNSRDMAWSTAIADAQLSYANKGGLGKPKSGIITKIFGIFWP
jgi:flagellar L-ring protein precursor FlgH